MYDLIGVIQKIVQNTVIAMKPADKSTGTVVSVSPLAVQMDTAMPPIKEPAVLLTDGVTERTAQVQGGAGGTVEVSKGLQPGDRVLMLRVQNGQQYIVLSRIV